MNEIERREPQYSTHRGEPEPGGQPPFILNPAAP